MILGDSRVIAVEHNLRTEKGPRILITELSDDRYSEMPTEVHDGYLVDVIYLNTAERRGSRLQIRRLSREEATNRVRHLGSYESKEINGALRGGKMTAIKKFSFSSISHMAI
jgi:hypothetical protein